MSEWRPIETAPKDGSSVLLVIYGFEPAVGYWDEERNTFDYIKADSMPSEQAWRDHVENFGTWAPTHWMPLPPDPNEKSNRIASLTEAVRVLTDEMEAIKRLSDTSPTRTLGEASDNLMHVNDHARAALTTAKELTK